MNVARLQGLIIDDDLKSLMPHMSCDEYRRLEDRITSEGCCDPIDVWKGIILNGHDRYEICLKNGIAFEVNHLVLNSHEEAVIWLCVNRLDSENLPMEMRKYLIGRRYAAEKVQYSKQVGKRRMLPKPEPSGEPHVTAARVGKDYDLKHTTVSMCGAYARIIDALAKKEPEIVPSILSGHIKLSYKSLVDLAKLPKSEVPRICHQLQEGKPDFSRPFGLQKNGQSRMSMKKHQPRPVKNFLTGSIKNMPIYDVDSDISSLALTIPSWVNIIDRTCANSDFKKISHEACERLQLQLSCLNQSVAKIALAIKETIDYE